ncbi:MAG: class I SAM-dependent DNA methyltransferase, partial [Anaerolineae bacterium]|nr:class I SAM-dependent DNA methyltransferase [Anaerolineae bacterium]
MLTVQDFVNRWGQSALREQQAAQSHFNELCQLVYHKTPTQLDPQGTFFTFEENVAKATGGSGRADVWYKGRFAWEYKGKHKDLDAAYTQLSNYRGALGNPPLLVVCDFLEYRIHPQWPNMSGRPFIFKNEDLLREDALRYIRWLLEKPEEFKNLRQAELEQRNALTLELAGKFAELARLMRGHKGADGAPLWTPMQVARFLTKLVFLLFAEDVDLLPRIGEDPMFRFFTNQFKKAPGAFVSEMRALFEALDGRTELYRLWHVPYFDGSLFADSAPGAGDGMEVLDMTLIPGAIDLLAKVSEENWREVNPAIFGTLFEGALDESKRAQLGAHYTGEPDIRLMIEPVLMQPINRQWDAIRAEAEPLKQIFDDPASPPRAVQEAREKLIALHNQMMDALANTRVLDPACGSGNFLYVSLRAMKEMEARIREFFASMQLPFRDVVTPRQLYGIEKDEFAARLAYVVVWIGYLQCRFDEEGILHPVYPHKIGHPRALPNPILGDDRAGAFLNDDAIMRYRPPNDLSSFPPLPEGEGTGVRAEPYEPEWPEVDVIVGNPPFLGGKRMRGELGNYVDDLFRLYRERVPPEADLVTYWFEKARAQIEQGKAKRAGLLATNSIRGGANREVLKRIKETGDIFMAWS